MSDIAFNSATELTAMLRGGKISSVELLRHYLDRVARLNPALNAIVAMNSEAAMARAVDADKALAAGQSWGPLHGLPMTIKDSFEVTGMPTTSGAPELRDHRSTENAVAVQRLLDAGAIIFGKTNVPLYTRDLQSYNTVYGVTNNPWDISRTPGGSSGGAAAAVAAGLCGMENWAAILAAPSARHQDSAVFMAISRAGAWSAGAAIFPARREACR